MDALTFISKLIDSLAWPVTVVIALVLLRRPLAELLPQMRKLKYKDFEAEFGEDVKQLEEEAKQVLPAEVVESARAGDPIEQLIEVSPSAAVLEAWRGVEAAAKRLLERKGHKLDYEVAAPYKLIERVLDTAAIDRRKLKIFADLRRLRNKVAHADEYEVAPARARDYVRLASALTADLDRT
jgi:hypothetical protein